MSLLHSLAARLTARFLLASCLIFGASALAVYWILGSGIRATEDRLLAQKIELFVSDQAQEPDDTRELLAQLAPLPPPGQRPAYLARILDPQGRILIQSPGMQAAAPEGYRLQVTRSKGRELQIALDASGDRALLTQYRKGLTLVVLAGLALLSLLTYFLTRKGLKPLDDSFGRLSQFSADLAHELRTPIHNLRLQADVVLSRPRKAAEYKEALESALEEYARLTAMAEGLLFMARAEHGKQALQLQKLESGQVFLEMKRRFSALAKSRGLSIAVEGGALIHADPSLLKQALDNLLANACEHTPARGKITLAAAAGPGGGASVTVKDSGRGIPAADLPRVFDRFFRGDASRRKSQGSGLGLSLVKTVMDLHQGEARVESRPGQGATVTLFFPA